ncbi:MAG TPA: hypothetical protein VGK61_09885 [Planctomycetota bacterium]
MKRLWIFAAVPLLTGCGYLSQRARDLGDIFRVEGSVGTGLQANVTAGELAHLGVGSSRRWSAGWAYGITTKERRSEDHFPLSYAWAIIEPETAALHVLKIGEGQGLPQHRCPVLGPAGFSSGSFEKPPMQYWDLEVGVMVLAVGFEVGFNPAELLDFILGIAGIDIAGDDDAAGRARRRLWVPVEPDLHSGK